ncbi:hypothetical protein [Tsukamurella soli]|uniref:DUF4276 domain-containing protein n=1 Tax=Tsukamurella soli TaxID=644556 RepID=A0ABP8K5U2_9ACTN
MSELPVIVSVVEGYGEVPSLPVLLRRVALEVHGTLCEVPTPHRLPSGNMRKPDELARAVRTQAQRVGDLGGVLIVMDGDVTDVPCAVDLAEELAPEPGLVSVRTEVVIPVFEFEAWFLAAASSLATHSAVDEIAQDCADAEPAEVPKNDFQP